MAAADAKNLIVPMQDLMKVTAKLDLNRRLSKHLINGCCDIVFVC